jgi:DNA-binding response OmpR family regulator
MSHDLDPLLGGKPSPTAYATEHLSFLNHTILLLQEVHLILISGQQQDEWVYVKCTPSEFIILARLLASPDYAVPFEELSPHLSLDAGDVVGPLQRHISRLKKKLPPGWTILCESGFGYRLYAEAIASPSEQREQ